MKRIILSFAILATLSLSTFANNTRNKDSHRKNPMNELGLTAEQQKKLKELNQDYHGKQKELADSHQADVNAILTPEQQAKFKEARQNKFKERRDDRKNLSHRGKRHRKDVKWDAETSSKLEALKENFRNDKKSIELTRVSPEEQKRRIDELRTKFRADRRDIIKASKSEKKNI